MKPIERYDVVVCGGGLAGLTAARQIKRTIPELSVLVLERTPGDIPDAAYKVGESTVEVGAHYFTNHLDLGDHFNTEQLPKLGLRFFFGDSGGPFEARPELGLRQFPVVPSYQIDRGIFERELRGSARELGVELVERADIADIELAADDEDHLIHYELEGEGASRTVRARFVVDASGRKRLIQRKLDLAAPSPHKINAAWWRFRGEFDIDTMAGSTSPTWMPKNQERRWFSTNHLMGPGYWVWMIPLSSGNTSVGIVADENVHPFNTYSTETKARRWLEQFEPTLADFVGQAEIMDALRLRNASHFSKQVFSHRRWSCVGEAAVFLDAFYSPGSDWIGYTNTITTRMIELDRAGRLTEEVTDTFNRLVLEDLWSNYLPIYLDNYPIFGHAQAMTTKVVWDTSFYWALPSQLFFRGLMADEYAVAEFHPIAQRFCDIQKRMQANLHAFAAQTQPSDEYQFVEYKEQAFCAELHLDLLTEKSANQCFSDMRRNVDRLESWAGEFEQELAKTADLPQSTSASG